MSESSSDGLPDGVELRQDAEGLFAACDGMALRCDFSRLRARVQAGRARTELVARAARVKAASPCALDATAGLGEDAFVLAAAGFQVELHERNPAVAALVRDGLARASCDERLAPIAARMTLVEDDGLCALERLAEGATCVPVPDVIYLDPMFPARTKSASVKKKAQLLQRLAGPCDDEEAERLLLAAVRARPRKVVVKRPAKGPWLAGMKPSHSLAGKAVRFDCYLPASMA